MIQTSTIHNIDSEQKQVAIVGKNFKTSLVAWSLCVLIIRELNVASGVWRLSIMRLIAGEVEGRDV